MKKNPLFIVLGVSAVFFVIFTVVSLSVLMSMSSGGSKPGKKMFAKAKNIGVLEVRGVILESKKLLEQIDEFEEDPSIKGVILRIDSPGGGVAPSQEIYQALKRLDKKVPVYSSMGSLAASGGYYVACGTRKVFANPGTLTGSIGVIMQFADLSRLYQWAKVNPYAIKTGKYKDIGSPSREMTAEEKGLLQEVIDNVLAQFRKAVAEGRKLPYEKVVKLSDGRIFSGEQAKGFQLVDVLGGFEDTVDALAKEVGISGKPHLVYANKKKSFLEKLIDEDAEYESSYRGKLASLLFRLFAGVDGGGVLPGVEKTIESGFLGGPLYLAPFWSGR